VLLLFFFFLLLLLLFLPFSLTRLSPTVERNREQRKDNYEERLRVEDEVARLSELETHRQETRRTQQMENKRYIDEQIRIKEWEKEMEAREQADEYLNAQRAEAAFTRRVQDELNKDIHVSGKYARKKVNWYD